VVIAIEDLHWIDKSSEEYLRDLLDSISGASVFLIFTYRPEFVPTWGGRSYHSQVNLNRLSNRESLSMLHHLLGTQNIEKNLEELILEKTEGVPFFIEELIKSLRDLKIIEKKENKYHLAKGIQDVSIPSTIQDVIMARIDSLPENAKEILQTGSVIEREFSYDLIKRVKGVSHDELLSNMSILKESELVYERGIYPESRYIFKHALTREVVYDSILTNRKKSLHDEIGKAIEELYKSNIDEYYGILTEHFILGENYEKGAKYSRLASKKSEKTASINDAVAFNKKRISCLERLPDTKNAQKEIVDARTALGLYYIQLNYPIEAKEAVDPIIDMAINSNHQRRLSQIYTIIGHYELEVEEDFPKALNYFEKALNIAQEVRDNLSLFFANYCLGLALFWSCEFEKAYHYFEKALEIDVATNTLYGISAMKTFLSWVNLHQGNVHIGHQTSEEALRMAEESGDIYSKSIAYVNHGFSYICRGLPEQAEVYLLKGKDLCENINFFIWSTFVHVYLGDRYFQIREYEKSKYFFEKAIRYLKQAKFGPSRINACRIGLIRAKVMSKEKDFDLKSLSEYVQENKVKELEGQIQRYMGEILLNIDDRHLSEAGDWIKKAIKADTNSGMMWHAGRNYALYAEVCIRKGEESKAKENLNKAIEIMKNCGADGWVEKYEKELAVL
jgi:tetratricopeptide (TPR) repeat protein